ncbi:flavin reductase family protein [Vibrio alfacsensis]|uniref:flavin reductase family protein n=1 Tax=Vibrio alfacsensis TaxID=1074311 RepID=UPI001C81CB62|nr:flavin reductase [Vibrio alfacsensis]
MVNLKFSNHDLTTMDKRKRTRLINSIVGFKSANLIGSIDKEGRENLAIVSSVIHLGSHPPLLAFIVRPRKSRRHTLENILNTQHFTINAVGMDFVQKAHQTSARYPKEKSEFEAVGLTAYYEKDFPAPFVMESSLTIGLALKEHIHIESNQTEMLIGEVIVVRIPEPAMMPDGYLDIELLDLVTISGLDSYHVTQRLHRLSYAKTDKTLFPLTREGEPSSWGALKVDID